MTQKFYLHDATSADTGTLPTVRLYTGTSADADTAGSSTNRNADGTIGALQVDVSTGAVGGDAWIRRYITPPLAAGSIGAGTWGFSAAGKRFNTTNDPVVFGLALFQWRPSTGSKIAIIFGDPALVSTNSSTSTTEAAMTALSISGSAFTLVLGDILVFEVYLKTTQINGGTYDFYYDGTTEGSITTNAAYILAPVDLPLSGAGPTGNPLMRRFPIPWELFPAGMSIE